MQNSKKHDATAILDRLAEKYCVVVDSPFSMYMDAFKHGNYELAEELYDAFIELQDQFDTARCVLVEYMKEQERYIAELEADLDNAITFIEIKAKPKPDRAQYNTLNRCKERLDTLGVHYG